MQILRSIFSQIDTKIWAKSNVKLAAGYDNEHGSEVNVSFSLFYLFVVSAPFNFFSTPNCHLLQPYFSAHLRNFIKFSFRNIFEYI